MNIQPDTIEAIANKCWTRIAANDGFFDEEFMKQCIFDAIMEGISKDARRIAEYEKAIGELRALFGDGKLTLDELVSRIETECYYASLG